MNELEICLLKAQSAIAQVKGDGMTALFLLPLARGEAEASRAKEVA